MILTVKNILPFCAQNINPQTSRPEVSLKGAWGYLQAVTGVLDGGPQCRLSI